MSRRKILLLTGWLLGLLAACSGPPADPVAPAGSAANTAPLRLAIDRWPGYYPAVLADDLGYFADAGIAVEVSLPDDTKRMLAEFAAGQSDLIGVALGDLITLTRSRADVAVLLVSDESAGGDAVLERGGLERRAGEPLRVGTNLGGFGELFVRELLPQLQIDPAAVEWINIDASAVPAALAEGRIDLGHCWEPFASEAEALGARRLASSADTPGLIPDVIAASHDLARQRPEALRAFAAAWFRAVDYWQAEPEAATARLVARLELGAGGASLKGIALQDAAANRRLLVEGGLTPVIDRYSAFFVAHGRLLAAVDAAAMLLPHAVP